MEEHREERADVGIGDRARHLAQDVTGKAKEAAGRARSDKPLENQGKRDQQLSQLKKAGEHLKAVFRR